MRESGLEGVLDVVGNGGRAAVEKSAADRALDRAQIRADGARERPGRRDEEQGPAKMADLGATSEGVSERGAAREPDRRWPGKEAVRDGNGRGIAVGTPDGFSTRVSC